MQTAEMRVVPVTGIPPVSPGDDLAGILAGRMAAQALDVNSDDVLVVAQKVVSKAEGAVVRIADVKPGAEALRVALSVGKDPRLVELVLEQSVRIVRQAPGVLITETRHGLVCANSGIDASNAAGPGTVVLLPEDPDRSALGLMEAIGRRLGVSPAVIISDSFNRPWRNGSINVAIGVAGIEPLDDRRGERDDAGRELKSTLVSVADEIASAAQLVMGESGGIPAALVRGLKLQKSNAGSRSLIRGPARDLFR